MKKLLSLSTLVFALSGVAPATQAADPAWSAQKTDTVYDIKVYRAASCGCCEGWIDHLKEHNFRVEDVVVESVDPYKQQFGVPAEGASCHTAVVNGKVIEGHVPAQDIKRLLASSNDIRLLTVPGMPSGGPGMDWEGARKDPFKVYAVSESEQVSIYRDYPSY